MAFCVKCHEAINVSESDWVKCVKCSEFYHYNCASLDNSKKPLRKSSFRCLKCSGSTSFPTTPNSDVEDTGGNLQVLQAISGLKTDFQEMLESKLSNVEKRIADKMEGSLSTIREEISNIKTNFQGSIDTIKKENMELKEMCNRLEGRLKVSSSEVLELKTQMHDMQQYSRNSNVEIAGVPSTKNENVYSILEKIAQGIGVPWNRNDISVAHRLPSNQKDRHPSIVVRFLSRSTRTEWLTAAKQKKNLSTVHLSTSFTPSPIYLNEHLTPYTKSVLSVAKRMVRDQQFAYAWVKEGRVLVRVSAEARPQRVNSISDVEWLAGGQRSRQSGRDNSDTTQATK